MNEASFENFWLPPKHKDELCVEVEDISFKSEIQNYKELLKVPCVIVEENNDDQVSKKKKFVSAPITKKERTKFFFRFFQI